MRGTGQRGPEVNTDSLGFVRRYLQYYNAWEMEEKDTAEIVARWPNPNKQPRMK